MRLDLGTLHPNPKGRKERKARGPRPASGHGKTSTRGMKGPKGPLFHPRRLHGWAEPPLQAAPDAPRASATSLTTSASSGSTSPPSTWTSFRSGSRRAPRSRPNSLSSSASSRSSATGSRSWARAISTRPSPSGPTPSVPPRGEKIEKRRRCRRGDSQMKERLAALAQASGSPTYVGASCSSCTCSPCTWPAPTSRYRVSTSGSSEGPVLRWRVRARPDSGHLRGRLAETLLRFFALAFMPYIKRLNHLPAARHGDPAARGAPERGRVRPEEDQRLDQVSHGRPGDPSGRGA